MSPEDGIWKGCGHKVKMVLISASPTSLARYLRFLEGNQKELCYDCWKAETEQPKVVILDNNPLSIAGYLEDHPEMAKKFEGEFEKPCEGCVHEPSITADEEGTVWGSDRDCETCIRMIGVPKDNYQPCLEVEKL